MKAIVCIACLLAFVCCLPAKAESLEDQIVAANQAARHFNCPDGKKKQFCNCTGAADCTCDSNSCLCRNCLYEPAKRTEISVQCDEDATVFIDGLLMTATGEERVFLPPEDAAGVYDVRVVQKTGVVRRLLRILPGIRAIVNCRQRRQQAQREAIHIKLPPQPLTSGIVRSGSC